MNQEQALQAAREKLPHIAEGIRVVRTHAIGKEFGSMDEFVIWDHFGGGTAPNTGRCDILARSQHSWEHALSLIEATRIEQTEPADQSPVEMEMR